MTASRERSIITTFVTLSNTLVEDYDVIDFTQTLVDASATVFDAVSAGLVLADASGTLDVLASTEEDAHLLDLLQLSAAGPCVDSCTSGEPVIVPDIAEVGDHWSEFRSRAAELDLRAAHCVPMRAQGVTLGSLNLFRARAGTLDPDDIAVVQGFADIATVGLLHQRAREQDAPTQSQLQRALSSRVVVEQAKGVLAYTHDISIPQAFELLRSRSRSTSTTITALARQILDEHH
ncbi:GAF and ANTAR domain-containing protein [Rathayibacter sp. VKM Ac-2857]|uniref:GAF and ANTAR domain-containing protein n=1 Tax=Rathayibacter sp. VKM Ac-2857 TaxID=2739020 RepID=UPI001564107E|nr:GAF and ANTAR domain-containing protein [Rathayibacter sp. VKM Ac-2857]NQX17925.1 GAF and ANTAR domain-containing protein [Rathayibacter sp. VKM Ac-2857]